MFLSLSKRGEFGRRDERARLWPALNSRSEMEEFEALEYQQAASRISYHQWVVPGCSPKIQNGLTDAAIRPIIAGDLHISKAKVHLRRARKIKLKLQATFLGWWLTGWWWQMEMEFRFHFRACVSNSPATPRPPLSTS